MKEIGSEFWDVPITENENGLFPENTQWFLSGRSALKAVISELKDCHTVAMPSWCCDSMIKPFAEAGIEPRFYPVYWNHGLVQEIDQDCDALLLMDYFGYCREQQDLSGFNGLVIRDVTHSLFSASCHDADYYFGSLRKWCGVWTGGYAWTKDGHELQQTAADDLGYVSLREKAMRLKKRYIDGSVDPEGRYLDKPYLPVFEKAEEMLEHIGALPAADRDIQLARHVDVDFIKTVRKSNAAILRAAFPKLLLFPETRETDCPMFVPILVPDGKRNLLRSYLIDREIYCPVHWPVSAYHNPERRSESIYQNELSLVCDQRYTGKEMERIVKTINSFLKEA